MQKARDAEILIEAIEAIPKKTKVYLTGGSLRNAIYYSIFKERLPNRDFDILVLGDFKGYARNLRAQGFTYGKIRRKNQVVLLKKRIAKPKDRLRDNLFLDIKLSQGKSIRDNLREKVNFTINGSAILLQDITQKTWLKQVITLPSTLSDIKRKRLVLNKASHPADLFAAMRFMSQGFRKPSKETVLILKERLKHLPKQKWERNLNKLFSYVGGNKQASKLLKELDLNNKILKGEF